MNPWEIVFGGIERALGAALAGIYAVIPSFGVAIILLTVGIRLVLYPITSRATRSMRKMQELQPHLKEIQERYKDDRAKQSETQMALFKANKVSPVSGCLPLLIQMPFLWAMYRVIGSGRRKGLEAGAFSAGLYPSGSALGTALATTTLAAPASAVMFLGINLGVSPMQAIRSGSGALYVVPQLVLVALIVATGLFQQRQMRAYRSDRGASAQAGMMQSISRIMPLAFGFFSMLWPAGLNLYWLTSNVFQIGQQALILRKPDDEVIVPDELKGKARAKPKPKAKPSGKEKANAKSTQAATGKRKPTSRPATSRGADGGGVSGRPRRKKIPERVPPKSRRKSPVVNERSA